MKKMIGTALGFKPIDPDASSLPTGQYSLRRELLRPWFKFQNNPKSKKKKIKSVPKTNTKKKQGDLDDAREITEV